MNSLWRYFQRLAGLWIFWFWFLALDAIGLIIDTFAPTVALPRWVYWGIPLVGFIVANLKLYSELESEKQLLEQHIVDLEDARADIRFKKVEDFCYVPSAHARRPFTGPPVELDYHSHLTQAGMPGWVEIGATLKGMKKSLEPGELVWQITDSRLPRLLLIEPGTKGAFQFPNGFPFNRIDDWKDDFQARFELPLRIADTESPVAFAKSLGELRDYRVVIRYCTVRGIESESNAHELALEGNFEAFKRDLCQKWQDWGFQELARLGNCE